MLKASVLLDRFLNKNIRYYDMHRIVTTRVLVQQTYYCKHWELSVYTGWDSNSPISIVPHLKLTSVLILKEPYSIEKCAKCLDTFLRF